MKLTLALICLQIILPPILFAADAQETKGHDEELKTQGFTVFKNLISPERIAELKKNFHSCEEKINAKIDVQQPKMAPYFVEWKKFKTVETPVYNLGWLDVYEQKRGRFEGIFQGESPESQALQVRNQELEQFVARNLADSYASFTGILQTIGQCEPGAIHRDTYPLFEQDRAWELQAPCFYLTGIIPLVDQDEEIGATELFPGSQRQIQSQVTQKMIQPKLNAGDVLVFDGRMFHRGGAKQSAGDRPMIFQVWHKKWYQEY